MHDGNFCENNFNYFYLIKILFNFRKLLGSALFCICSEKYVSSDSEEICHFKVSSLFSDYITYLSQFIRKKFKKAFQYNTFEQELI